jgi:hypothetical protein
MEAGFHFLRTFQFTRQEPNDTEEDSSAHGQDANFQRLQPCLYHKLPVDISSQEMLDFTSVVMFKLADAIWKSGENFVDHITVLNFLTWEAQDGHVRSARYEIDDDKTVVAILSDGQNERKKEMGLIRPGEYFHFLGIVLFDLSEGNKYNKSKQFLREARMALAKVGRSRSLRDTADLNQPSEDGSWLSIGFDWKPHSGQVCCFLPVDCEIPSGLKSYSVEDLDMAFLSFAAGPSVEALVSIFENIRSGATSCMAS